MRYKRPLIILLQWLGNKCAFTILYSPSWLAQTSALTPCVSLTLLSTETLEKGGWYSDRLTGMLVGAVTGKVSLCPVAVVGASMVPKMFSEDYCSLR